MKKKEVIHHKTFSLVVLLILSVLFMAMGGWYFLLGIVFATAGLVGYFIFHQWTEYEFGDKIRYHYSFFIRRHFTIDVDDVKLWAIRELKDVVITLKADDMYDMVVKKADLPFIRAFFEENVGHPMTLEPDRSDMRAFYLHKLAGVIGIVGILSLIPAMIATLHSPFWFIIPLFLFDAFLLLQVISAIFLGRLFRQHPLHGHIFFKGFQAFSMGVIILLTMAAANVLFFMRILL